MVVELCLEDNRGGEKECCHCGGEKGGGMKRKREERESKKGKRERERMSTRIFIIIFSTIKELASSTTLTAITAISYIYTQCSNAPSIKARNSLKKM